VFFKVETMQNKSLLRNIVSGTKERIFRTFKNPYRHLDLNFFKLKYLKHLPPGKVRYHKLKSGIIAYINAQELLHGFDEIFVQELYKIKLPPECYIIDCGANIGLSIIYFKQLYPKAHIVAFEPDDQNFHLLSENISSFSLKDVELRKEAVWIENTTIGFSNEGSMSSKISEENPNSKKVKTSRLKEFLSRKVDFLKIDIEGAEYAVVKDIEELLFNVENMFIEYHGTFGQSKELIHILNILSKNSFTFYIKEATAVYPSPFADSLNQTVQKDWDIQLNIFCFRV
jgi:FkbM family methyltransferase